MPAEETASNPHRLTPTVTPRSYRLVIAPDIDGGTFTGSVTIQADVTTTVSEIVMHNSGLEITSATVDGETVEVTIDAEREQMRLAAQPTGATTTIAIDYHGKFNDKLVGFYLSRFTDESGTEHRMATTQFEAPYARMAFPCWDEPAYKATFEISLHVPEGLQGVSNAAEVDRQVRSDGSHIISFAPTMVMSTYLVAWVIGPLEFSETRMVDGIPLRVVSRAGLEHMATFALDAGEFALGYFADYFGVPYPGDKVDLIAIPDFAFGAMENLGCITFREAILMVDPEITTQTEMQRSVDVVNHELAHMWFGDLVTMSWWNGIWLNEAFATFMEMKCTDAYRPEWKRWSDFGISRTAAFAVDALASTRPIEFTVNTPQESEGMFDILTYEKGAAVVRMLEQHLGENVFREGLRSYMSRHAYGNTETTDLWDAIEESSGQPVRTMMDDWIFQGGFPLISVTRKDGVATLAQSRCQMAGGELDYEPATWATPIRYRTGPTELGREPTVGSVVLGAEPVTIDLGPGDPWVMVNANGASFVRVAYTAAELERLAILPPGELSDVERYGLIDDTWAAVLADRISTTTFLTLLESMATETERVVWQRILSGLHRLKSLTKGEARTDFAAIAHDVISPMLANLGLAPIDGEDQTTRELRGDLIKALGTTAEDGEVQDECRRTVAVGGRDASLVDPSLMAAAISVVGHCGDAEDFESFAERYRISTVPQEQLRYLYSLARFPDPDLVARLRAMILKGEVRSQNAPFALRMALENPVAGHDTWEFIKENWAQLNEMFATGAISRMVDGVTALDTPDMVDDVARFMDDHPVPQAQHQIRQILERQRMNTALRAREADTLSAFVSQ